MHKSFPYHPTNVSFDPELSLNSDDISSMVEHGFNVVLLYCIAWQGGSGANQMTVQLATPT